MSTETPDTSDHDFTLAGLTVAEALDADPDSDPELHILRDLGLLT